jgi:hypothetical protein
MVMAPRGQDLMRKLHDQDELTGIAISGYGVEEDIEKSRACKIPRTSDQPGPI